MFKYRSLIHVSIWQTPYVINKKYMLFIKVEVVVVVEGYMTVKI